MCSAVVIAAALLVLRLEARFAFFVRQVLDQRNIEFERITRQMNAHSAFPGCDLLDDVE